MSIHHQFIVTCDQDPLPNRCGQRILIDAEPELLHDGRQLAFKDAMQKLILGKDWGIVDVHGKKAHYCPYHRPIPSEVANEPG